MKYAVGYQLNTQNDFCETVKNNCAHISEVYFPWVDNASGRSPLQGTDGYTDWSACEKLISDLVSFRTLNIKLDLLFNGACYGDDAVSVNFENYVMSILDYMNYRGCGADIVTTTSPAVAFILKKHYSKIEVRASVNMRIGTVKGMQYMADLFDSFYIARERNRDLKAISEMKRWADGNGKGLCILANSGCMIHCSCQSFHDNLVAHTVGANKRKPIDDFSPCACREYLKKAENWVSLLQNTWIRPEDIHHYEEYFTTVKLATRMHSLPALVIDSYVRERYIGNLLDLCEPGYGPLLAPFAIDNTRFPKDWFEKTTLCDKCCQSCTYCNEVIEKVIVNTES
jgi:Collagenase and related proteases